MTPHSELPWKVEKIKIEERDILIIQSEKYNICSIAGRLSKEAEANAAFIVRACNNHEKLVIACKMALDALQAQGIYEDCIKYLQSAIQSAEEGR